MIGIFFGFLLVAACGTEEEQGLPDEQALATLVGDEVAATDAAVGFAHGDGVLVGEASSVAASELAVEDAFGELAKWGLNNPGEVATRPSAGTRV